MKKLIILVTILTQAFLLAQAHLLETDQTYVYDSQTNSYTPLGIDDSLTFLDGQLPTEEPEEDTQQHLIPAHIVHGEDWYQVSGTQYPYSAITYIQTKTEQCSGAMVGNSAVLTAAHCVYENGKLANASHINVYAGRKGSAIHARGKQIFVLNGYTQYQQSGFDYAIIILTSPIGKQSGYLGSQKVKLEANKKIRLAGFPNAKPANNPWLSPGKIMQVFEEKFLFAHDADMLAGSSGSPIFESQGNRIIGVNIADSKNNKKIFNVGVTSERLLSFIKEYRDKL